MGAFLGWAMHLLSVAVQIQTAEVYRQIGLPEWVDIGCAVRMTIRERNDGWLISVGFLCVRACVHV